MSSGKTMAGPSGPVSRSNGEAASATRRSSMDSIPNAIPDDPPPAYTDDEDTDLVPHTSNIVPNSAEEESLRFATIIEGKQASTYRERSTYEVTLHPEYSNNPDLLCKTIERQAMLPPVPFIHIQGSHIETSRRMSTQSRRNSNQSDTSRSKVVDFDFYVDTAGMVLPVIAAALAENADLERDGFWRLDVVQDNDDRRAYRGGRFKSRVSKRRRRRCGDQEAALLQNTTLEDWCFRFCSNRARVKSFTFRREISKDWDNKTIEAEITALIRSLNYEGDIDINFELKHSHITFYSPHLFNRLRTNEIVWWLFVLLQLWILAWPILILLERRYEPVTALWRTRNRGKYAAGMSETDMVNFLAPAIRNAASGCRKNGEVITIHHVDRMREHAIREARWHSTGVGMAGLVDESTAGAAGVTPGQILRAQAVVPPGQEDTWMGTLMGFGRNITRAGSELGRSYGWGGHQV